MRKFEIANGFEDKDINLPIRTTKYSAGYDFEAAEDVVVKSIWNTFLIKSTGRPFISFKESIKKGTLVKTGVKASMEEGEYLALASRSSNYNKLGLILANSIGIIDKDYYGNPENDGNIMFNFINFGFREIRIKKGDRIGQGIFQKFLLTDDDISEGDRISGFGSTGK